MFIALTKQNETKTEKNLDAEVYYSVKKFRVLYPCGTKFYDPSTLFVHITLIHPYPCYNWTGVLLATFCRWPPVCPALEYCSGCVTSSHHTQYFAICQMPQLQLPAMGVKQTTTTKKRSKKTNAYSQGYGCGPQLVRGR